LLKFLLLTATTAIWSSPLLAAPLTERVFAAWFGEIEYLEKVCGTLQVDDDAKTALLDAANILNSEIEQGGELYFYYLSGSVNASSRFFGASQGDICYYLKSAVGEQGYLATGIALPE
jgi:hypothetical protein